MSTSTSSGTMYLKDSKFVQNLLNYQNMPTDNKSTDFKPGTILTYTDAKEQNLTPLQNLIVQYLTSIETEHNNGDEQDLKDEILLLLKTFENNEEKTIHVEMKIKNFDKFKKEYFFKQTSSDLEASTSGYYKYSFEQPSAAEAVYLESFSDVNKSDVELEKNNLFQIFQIVLNYGKSDDEKESVKDQVSEEEADKEEVTKEKVEVRINTNVNDINEELQRTKEKLKANNKATNQKLSESLKKIDMVDDDINKLNLDEKFNTLNMKIGQIKGTNKHNETVINDYETTRTEQLQTIDELEKTIAELEKEKKQYQESLRSWNNYATKLKPEIETLKAQIAAFEKEKKQIQQESKDSTDKEDCSAVKKELDTANAEIEKLKESNNQQVAEIDKLKAQIEVLDNKNKEKEEEKQSKDNDQKVVQKQKEHASLELSPHNKNTVNGYFHTHVVVNDLDQVYDFGKNHCLFDLYDTFIGFNTPQIKMAFNELLNLYLKKSALCDINYCIFVFVRINKTSSAVYVLSNYFHTTMKYQVAVNVKKRKFQKTCENFNVFLGLKTCVPIDKNFIDSDNKLLDSEKDKYSCLNPHF